MDLSLLIPDYQMEDLTLVLVVILFICSIIYFVLNYRSSWKYGKQLTPGRRVMLVIGHPDDEVMFFGPTILGLVKKNDVYLLCLSMGDFRGQGKIRKEELYSSCKILGIPEQNIILVSHSTLKDDPNVRWREELVSDIVSRHVSSLAINTVITFDRHGISSHKNHISIYYAMACLALEEEYRSVYCLTSVNLLRKYSFLVDIPMSYLLCSIVYMASPVQWLQLRSAMFAHSSQLTWYRWLYITFSRYMLINTLEPISRPSSGDKKSV
eukprot:TRINITY_DN3806_c0_g1_i1.p1 TRINITY_DN3806_c0_g1~~TRINITY_DN3806_c0_g1_i1.p1  ORF type:complete len:267 (-),score=37.66 TRINITY_DN3806_c0_g1_i1:613-1413(-)